MDLHLVDDELASCVGCGLCLPHCPTFRVTGEEALSPRGRIAAMRAVQWEGAAPDGPFVHFMETCVQCRGCEPACPSGVPFGHLMEGTRDTLARHHRMTPRWQRVAFWSLGHHALVLAGSSVLAVLQRLHLAPRRLGLPLLPLRRTRLRSSGDAVWLFTGCVMDAWLRPTHAATLQVIEATGTGVRLPGRGADCCGALHTHAGLTRQARRLARRVMRAFPGDAPILVNSAGCGAALKDYGHLLGTAEARAFAARVLDIHEWLADRLDLLPPAPRRLAPVIVQDPCHLRHVQRSTTAVRAVLAHVADVVELDDDGLCCGAGGAYSALEPELAGAVRQRKVEAVERATARTGARVVASANPGCAIHLRAAGLIVRHPVNLVAQGISGEPADQLAPALAADPAGF
jgi:glycolate oxidase iron-sulfur subunit